MNMLSKAASALTLSAAVFSPLSVDATNLPQQSPTNSNPVATQVRKNQRAVSLPPSSLKPFVFIAQATPTREVAHQQPDRSNLSERPSGYGEAGAAVIVGLEDQINKNNQIIQENDQGSAAQLQQNGAKLQEFLEKNRQKKVN